MSEPSADRGRAEELECEGPTPSRDEPNHPIGSRAGQAETLRNPAQRDESFFECKVGDEAALERAVTLGDRFGGRVGGLRHGVEGVFEVRTAGMDLRALKILAPLGLVEKLLDAIDP
jgi:hypothetical protein